MAFDNNQQEPTLPNDNEKYIRKSININFYF